MAGSTNPQVAVVDDDSRIRESVGSLLEAAGFDAVSFASAEEFIQSGDARGVRCLIADVRMPGMNGLDLQRKLRVDRPDLSVIFISGHCDEAARRRALDDGAVCFLQKPFDAGELLPVIRTVLRRSTDD